MRTIHRITRLGASLMVMGLVAACGDDAIDDEAIAEKNESVDVLYDKAFTTLNGGEFKPAIEEFEEVERQHPYSPWASQAQVMAAYSAYRGGYYEDAIVILDRFVKLHPTHKAAPYAFYLKALCYYIQITDVGRDQKMTEEARSALKEVITRYPNTEYAQDAKLKLDLTSDHLAGKEMEIGRYYLQRDEYAAAVSRFKYVVDTYETTSHIPEALHRLVECYLRLGVVGEAKKYAAVLGHNFPGSDWYQYSYKMLKGNLSPEEKEGTFDKYLKVL
ncbi:MAG: outer membrane protein assembly factor BamD [Rickettsiales bacterium]